MGPELVKKDPRVGAIREVLRSTYFPWLVRTYFPNLLTPPPGNPADTYLAGEQGRNDLDNHAFRRFNDCVRWIVPWVSRHIDLSKAAIAEIGCGTGSSTAAFAQSCASITGYDIDPSSTVAAAGRLSALGLTNARIRQVSATDLLDALDRDHPDRVDVVLCYAVLEHCTLAECLETISRSFARLRPGGLLVVADTPNRLAYFDAHTSFLPFFTMLPDEVAIRYAHRSPRPDFDSSLREAAARGEEEARLRLTRWGRAISYHEFELALREDLTSLVVGDGFDPEILDVKPIALEEELLLRYWEAQKISVPRAFARRSIDVILRKPEGSPQNWPPRESVRSQHPAS